MFAPNTITENLMQQKKPHAAMVLDALFAADIANWQSIEISTILHYFSLSGIGIGESIVRRGLFELARLGLMATRKIMTRGKGRPRYEYRLGTVNSMAKILGVKLHQNEAADAIPASGFKSAKAYRASKHVSLLKRLGTSYLSRKKLGARLGVGGRSTFNYELESGIQVNQRIERTQLSMADVVAAPSKRINANVFLEVEFERELSDEEFAEKYKEFDPSMSIFWRRTTTDKKYMPYTAFILARELQRGNRVFKVKQITNEYIA